MKSNHIRIASIILYLIALSQKSYCTNNDCGELGSGLVVVLLGAFGMFASKACIAWLANPLLFLSWIMYRWKAKLSFLLNFISLAIALSFLFFNEIIIDEAGTIGKITGYALGYWIWLISILVLLVGNTLNWKKLDESKPRNIQ